MAYTVEPLNKGHNRNNLSIKDTSYGPKCAFSHSTNTFSTSKERKPLYKGKNSWSQRVLYSEVPVYMYNAKSSVHIVLP